MAVEPHLGEAEPAYHRHFLPINQVLIGYAIAPAVLASLFFIRIDYVLLGPTSAFFNLLIVRCLYVIVSIAVFLRIRRVQQPAQLEWLTFAWTLLTALSMVYAERSRPAAYIGHYALDVVVMVALYLIPNRLGLRLTSALCFSFLVVFGLFFTKAQLPTVELNAILTACLLANLLGFITSTRLFTYRRQQFLAVLEAQRAKDEVAALAMTDPLTGVFNRRRFIEQGTDLLVHFNRYHQPFCVHIIDIDFFKQINDTYGHSSGDAALQQFTQLVTQQKRETDIFGRLGGEEFGLILPNTLKAAAVSLGDRLRQHIAATPITLADTQVAITVSLGIAEVSPADQDFTAIMDRADQLLYQAKRNGRNRVEA